jgi:hypothetical protein
MIDTINVMFARINQAPYDLLWQNSGAFCAEFSEGVANFQGKDLYLMIETDQAKLNGDEDVFEILAVNSVEYICPISARTLTRPTPGSTWETIATQDYHCPSLGIDGTPMVPRHLNIGDVGEIDTSGRWTWFDNKGNTGAGDWQYHCKWMVAFGRLVIDELYTGQTDGVPGDGAPSHRIHHFDLYGGGRLGFKDLITDALIVVPSWVGK